MAFYSKGPKIRTRSGRYRSKAQLNAISKKYSEKRREDAKQEIIKIDGSLEKFKKSKYKTMPGYLNFLKRQKGKK